MKKVVSAKIDGVMHDKLFEIAEEKGISVNQLLQELIKAYLKKEVGEEIEEKIKEERMIREEDEIIRILGRIVLYELILEKLKERKGFLSFLWQSEKDKRIEYFEKKIEEKLEILEKKLKELLGEEEEEEGKGFLDFF